MKILARFRLSIWRFNWYRRRANRKNLLERVALASIQSMLAGGVILSGLPQIAQVLFVGAIAISFAGLQTLMPPVIDIDKRQLFDEFEQKLVRRSRMASPY